MTYAQQMMYLQDAGADTAGIPSNFQRFGSVASAKAAMRSREINGNR